MMRSLYTASTGMYAQQLNVDTLAHNMANVNTAGFKKQRVEFQDLLYQTIKRPASGPNVMEPVGLEVGLGVKPSAINTLFKQGNLQQTENPLDVAIQGDGFFGITVGDQTLYTRDGAIKIDASGNLVTADGNLYLGAEAISDPNAYDINIAKDGTITYQIPGDDTAQEAGKLQVFKFMNPAGLLKVGKNLYQATANSGEAQEWDSEDDSTTSIQSGYLEMSNVQIVEEMVNLITAQRAYEINSKVIQSSDEMLQTATNLRR